MQKILIIDDDTFLCDLLEGLMKKNGYSTQVAFNRKGALDKFKRSRFDLVFLDYRLPDGDGMELLKEIKKVQPDAQVVIITAYSDVRMAVKLIKNGAIDYVVKPIQPDEIVKLVKKALEKSRGMQAEVEENFVVGKSKEMAELLRQARIVAPTSMSVLIEGETGSGKEFVARYIHMNSKRKNKAFVAVDCGAIPKELANSELFGHVKGAFTGAIKDKKGYFEQANGGTIFLDEIGNLSLEIQVKLLRIIQDKVVTRTGGSRGTRIDLRLITATNENLMAQVKAGHFREDLYHRINEFKTYLPPLRERKEDIPMFLEHFLAQANTELDRNVEGFDRQAMAALITYPWHGNIRELKNVIKRAVLLAKHDEIGTDALPEEIVNGGIAQDLEDGDNGLDLKDAASEAEKSIILNALAETNYNKTKAAKVLNIDRKTLYNKMQKMNISLDE